MSQPVQVTISDQDSMQLLLTLDASLNETHAQDAEATDHPVEQGANITDHIRPKPRMVTIEGMMTNTPLLTARLANGSFFPDQPGAAEAAHQFFDQRLNAGQLHIIRTKLDTYENMMLVSKNEPRNAQIGDSLQFTLIFKQIRIVQNKTVTVKTASAQHKPKLDKGLKPLDFNANLQPAQKTGAASIFDVGRGTIGF